MSELGFRVGLGGGIGSGKSTVASLFEQYGASIVDTDVIAHELTRSEGPAMAKIADRFGPGVLQADGSLDRAAMRTRVFANPDARLDLEGILHPLIRVEAQQRCLDARGMYVILVIPLLVERLDEYRPLLDRIAVVDCPEELQIARAGARPGLGPALVKTIMASQSERRQRLEIADDVIENSLGVDALAARIQQLHGLYATLAQEKKWKGLNNGLR